MSNNLPTYYAFNILGPSQCGKTMFVSKLLLNKEEMIFPNVGTVHFCYSQWQEKYNDLLGVTFHEGLMDFKEINSKLPSLIVIDDLMDSLNEEVMNLFTKYSHHQNISVVYITQNIFQQSKFNRTMSLNSSYMVLFKNPRDIGQVEVLGRQMYGKKSKSFASAFKDATSEPHGYLLIDLKQEIPEKLRLRSNIFSDEHTIVYLL